MAQTPRRVTDPPRGFPAAGLSLLSRETRQALVLAVLAHRRLRIVEMRPRADFDELVVSIDTGLRHRMAAVRIFYRTLELDDMRDAKDAMAGGSLADITLIQASDGACVIDDDQAVAQISPEQLISALEGCPFVTWRDGSPAVDRAERTRLRELETEAWLESDAFSWLSIVARNKVPYGLGELRQSPDALLERATFRVFTHVLRFGGERLGEARRGQALPDALLTVPGSPQAVAILDTKAARDGYTMSRDDQRALQEYVRHFKPDLAKRGQQLQWAIIVSSEFPGANNARHPYYARAQALREAGATLVYLPAGALAGLARSCEELQLSPTARESFDWPALLDSGLVDAGELDGLLMTEPEE